MTRKKVLNNSNEEFCYLCNKKLEGKISSDHVIPDKLFTKEDPNRPQLYVHHSCNDLKSKEDEWFMRHLQLRCSTNPKAELEFSKMMDKAIIEKQDAYIVGKKLRNYKLVRTMLDDVRWGIELYHNGKHLKQFIINEEETNRFESYIKKMCLGLFIFNVENSQPTLQSLILKHYAGLDLSYKKSNFFEEINKIFILSERYRFGQQWGDKILYFGSRVQETKNKGFIFIQFYSQLGILASFE